MTEMQRILEVAKLFDDGETREIRLQLPAERWDPLWRELTALSRFFRPPVAPDQTMREAVHEMLEQAAAEPLEVVIAGFPAVRVRRV